MPTKGAAVTADLTWGIFVPHGGAGEYAGWSGADAWARLRDSAATFEGLGYDHLWLSDHLMASGDRSSPYFEGYSTLAALSQVTGRAGLGALVTCAYYRNAGLLAKQAAAVDVMSGGRLILGLGGGWDEEETKAFGYEFPSARDRYEIFAETVDAVTGLFSGRAVDYAGRHIRLSGAYCNPAPLHRPPLWTGTHGPKGLRVAARSADVANWNCGLARFRELSAELDLACAEVGRDRATIDTSVFRLALLGSDDRALAELLAPLGIPAEYLPALRQEHFIGTPDEVIPHVQAFVDAGARHLIVMCLDSATSDHSAKVFRSQVIPAITVPH